MGGYPGEGKSGTQYRGREQSWVRLMVLPPIITSRENYCIALFNIHENNGSYNAIA
jgi:hypothetical protein